MHGGRSGSRGSRGKTSPPPGNMKPEDMTLVKPLPHCASSSIAYNMNPLALRGDLQVTEPAEQFALNMMASAGGAGGGGGPTGGNVDKLHAMMELGNQVKTIVSRLKTDESFLDQWHLRQTRVITTMREGFFLGKYKHRKRQNRFLITTANGDKIMWAKTQKAMYAKKPSGVLMLEDVVAVVRG